MKIQRKSLDPDRWLRRPVIPVIWDRPADLAPLRHASAIFVQGSSLNTLPDILDALSDLTLRTAPVLVHLDLLAGIAADEAGLEYLASLRRVDGIITTRHHLIPIARRMHMCTVLRLFLQDGRAVERGLAIAGRTRPDALELLPGVAAVEVADDFNALPTPRIAGGLIRATDTIHRILASGCRAISTSDQSLWAMNHVTAQQPS